MYSLNYKRIETLPKLAWLADINKASMSVTVYVGSKVECRENFFVTGVWDGKFEEAQFDSAEFNLSTGAIIEPDGIKFVTPSHALERILLAEDDERYAVSNSFPFILAYNNFELDDKFDQYESVMCSLLNGTKKLIERIPLKNGKFVRQFIVSLVKINNDLSLSVSRRPLSKGFVSYDDYYTRMMNSMKLIRENSISENRRNSSFDLCSTVSAGYDSCANAAIAKSIGCDKALSLSGGVYDEDSGEPVANQLGYAQVIKRNRYSYRDKTGFIDAEYNSSGEMSKHLQFSVFEDVFQDSLVFMGTRGDYYWGLETCANSDFEMVGFYTFEMDISYTENALRNGYIFVPMATYGATASESLRRIMLSEEMKPWKTGTSYDRPIPRRILEDFGVSRESFGMTKYGGGFSFCFDTMKTLEKKMTYEGYKDFCEYKKKKKPYYGITRIMHLVQYQFMILPTYINVFLGKLGIKIQFNQKPTKLTNPGIASDLLHWSVDVMINKYKNMMSPIIDADK